jgi:tripartite ATP-independent transporter DctM subunit
MHEPTETLASRDPRRVAADDTSLAANGRHVLSTVVNVIDAFCRAILVLSLSLELIVVLSEIASRLISKESILWSDEAAKFFLSMITFIGGPLAYRAKLHTTVEAITAKFSGVGRRRLAVAIDAAVLAIAAVAAYAAIDFLTISSLSSTPILEVNAAWLVAPLALGMFLTMLFALERLLIQYVWGHVFPVAGSILSVFFVAYLLRAYGSTSLSGGASLVGMLIIFLIAVLIGLPVAFAMLLGSVLFLLLSGTAPIVAVAQNTFDGTGNFVLLTLPFFIWAGLIMEKGGISVRLVRFAMALVGHMRGGLLQVAVLSIYMVSGISGSKIADVVAVGSVLRRELKRQGYSSERAAAVLASSAAMSETIPPSIAMLVLGSVAPISVGTLFVAGLVPAAAIAVILFALNYFLSLRSQQATAKQASLSELLKAFRAAILPLVMPVIMVIGIRFGVATPTEISAVAVVYGVALSVCVYRSLSFRSLYKIATDCCLLGGMVLFIIAAAFSFGWTLTAAGVPSRLASLLHSTSDSSVFFIVASIFLLVVVGSLLEGLPALIILGPLLIPLAGQYGINPVHYSMIIILSMGTGIFMPPIGIGFYVSCAVSESRLEGSAKAMLPYLAALIAGIALIAFVPSITLALPKLLSGR